MNSPTTVSKYVMEELNNIVQTLKKEIGESVSQGVRYTCVIDEWTSVTGKRYMNITIVSNKQTINLGMARCSGSLTSEITIKIAGNRLQEFSLPMDTSVAFASDGASVMVKAGRLLRDAYDIEHQICHAHGVHLGMFFCFPKLKVRISINFYFSGDRGVIQAGPDNGVDLGTG